MPLKKLWNALRGSSATAAQTSADHAAAPGSEAAPVEAGVANKASAKIPATTTADSTAKRRGSSAGDPASSGIRIAASTRSESTVVTAPRREKSRTISVRKTSLTKTLRKEAATLDATKVLWLGVQECSVGAEAIQFLTAGSKAQESKDQGSDSPTPQLIVVEQFEAGDGPVSLMQFHRELRQHDLRPMMFPEAPAEAIARVGRTVGGVDLVLVERGPWNVDIERVLGRITSPQTCVLRFQSGQWQRLRIASAALPAAA